MRIVCQKCSAVYAIDDKVLTPKGVRAQCPRCRNLQLVKPETQPAGAAVAPPPPPKRNQPGATPAPPSTQPSQPLQFDPFANLVTEQEAAHLGGDPGGLPPGLSGAPGEDPLDFSDLLGPAGAEPKTVPRSSPFGDATAEQNMSDSFFPAPPGAAESPGSGDLDMGFDALPPPPGVAPKSHVLQKSTAVPSYRFKPDSSAPIRDQLGPSAEGNQLGAGPAELNCKTCGKPLDDPFDQAIGTCDDCRNTAPNSLGSESQGANFVEVPLPPDAMVEIKLGKKEAKPDFNSAKTRLSAERPDQDGISPRKILIIAAASLLVFGGGGAYLLIKKPWVRRPPPLAQRLPISSARPIDAMVDRLRTQFPQLTGSAAEHVAAGEEKFALDTPAGYAQAETEFLKALVLDKTNDRAVAGWALALAFGKGQQIDDDTQKMAEQMLVAAEQRGGDARVYVAHAHLMIVRSANLNDVQALAERGFSSASDKDKALAYLALGQAFLNKNAQAAEKNLNLAVQADPKLKRASIFQAQFMMTQGHYKTAVSNLEKRLQGDADQFEVADLLAKLHLELGDKDKARRVYEQVLKAQPNGVRPRLARAVFAYQHENSPSEAASSLDALLADKAKFDKVELADVLGHRAAVARVLSDNAGAIRHATAALEAQPNHLNARVQKILAMSTSPGTDLEPEFKALKLNDAPMEEMLNGRVLMAAGKFVEAFERFKKAYELDSRHTDAAFMAGACAMLAKNEVRGWEYALGKALKADPFRNGMYPPMASIYVSRNDFLGAARGIFAAKLKEKEDPNPPLAEGAIAWHLGDLAAADAAFAKVLTADMANGTAFAYRALIAIKRRSFKDANKFGEKAVSSERASGLAHAALGWSLLVMNKPDQARKSLLKAVELAPHLPLTRTLLAEADFKVKKKAEPLEALTTILLKDSSYSEAKRVLYEHGP